MAEKKDHAIDWREIAAELADELRWCSGSADFAPGGKARKGWVRGPQKVLKKFDAAWNLSSKRSSDG